MKTELYYFTGTGNGLHIAKSIKKSMETDIEKVRLIPINTLDLSKGIKTDAHRVGIIFPTYAMTAPAIVKNFASKLEVDSQSYVFLYAHCGGGGASGAAYDIQKILNANNIKISNSFQTTFPSNSAILSYTPEKLTEVLAKSETSLKHNIEPIFNSQKGNVSNPSLMKNLSSVVMGKAAKILENIMQFDNIHVDDTCISCSTCEKVCPMGNVIMENGKPYFGDKCEMCLACVNQCPKKSLAYGKMKKEKLLSYRHPEVSLKELMYR